MRMAEVPVSPLRPGGADVGPVLRNDVLARNKLRADLQVNADGIVGDYVVKKQGWRSRHDA